MWLMKLFFCRKLNNKLSFLIALALALLAIATFTVNLILYKAAKFLKKILLNPT